MRKLIKETKIFYTNLPIKYKLFVTHFLIVLVVCLISLTAIQIALNIYQDVLCIEAAKVLNLSTQNIENELKQIEKYSYNIITNSQIQYILGKLREQLSVYERGKLGDELTERLWTFRFERNITSVNIIDICGNQYAGGDMLPEDLVKPIVTQVAAGEGSMVYIEPLPGETEIIGARQIREIHGLSLEPLGTLILRINTVNLIKQLKSHPVEDVNLFIVSGGKIIHSSTHNLRDIVASIEYNGDTGHIIKEIDGKKFFIVHTRSSFNNWFYINVLPYDIVFKRVLLMKNVVLAIFIGLFLLTVYISMRLAQNLTKPIEDLTKKMKRVENGEFDIREEDSPLSKRTDEIGTLQKDFMIMIRKINTLIKESYTKQLLVKDAQLKALQAQINPHFLYNALEAINWRAKIKKEKDISLMVESLGNLLRNTISKNKQMVTIREEIKLLNDYIIIQKVRFGNRLQFFLEVDERWNDMSIPKLTLQPIVENSINYGLEKMLEVCRITVKSTADDDSLYLTVEDNGPGIPPDILQKLQKGEIQPKGLGIGLKNIDQRLKLIYGGQYGITVSSELGMGTSVTIRIPKMRV